MVTKLGSALSSIICPCSSLTSRPCGDDRCTHRNVLEEGRATAASRIRAFRYHDGGGALRVRRAFRQPLGTDHDDVLDVARLGSLSMSPRLCACPKYYGKTWSGENGDSPGIPGVRAWQFIRTSVARDNICRVTCWFQLSPASSDTWLPLIALKSKSLKRFVARTPPGFSGAALDEFG